MSSIWETLSSIEKQFEAAFHATGSIIPEPKMEDRPTWINKSWKSSIYRKAHLNVIDARESYGLWMMHCCVYPRITNSAPIFGFDVFASRTKITGCFIDFSPTIDENHPMIEWFGNQVASVSWKKTRKLPEWAQEIFSPHIIAASNVNDEDELNQVVNVGVTSLNHYLETIDETQFHAQQSEAIIKRQLHYIHNQRKNPRTPKVLCSLGLSEDEANRYVNEYLFPEY